MKLSLKNIYSYYASHPESSWIMQPQKIPFLHEFVKEHPVKKVLDLGTGIGCTAAIIAYTLKDKGENFEIHTVEQNEKCYKLSQEIMPEELKDNIVFHLAEPVIWETDKIPYKHFSNFKELPEGDWDLILTDGPGPFVVEDKYIELPNGDVLKMCLEDKIKPGTFIAWDGRMEALRTIERYFSDNFYLALTAETAAFNVIERKEGELKFRDEKLEEMKAAKYI